MSNGTHTLPGRATSPYPTGRHLTVATTDTTAPSVNRTSPINGATGVARTTSVRATFSEEISKYDYHTTFSWSTRSTGNRVSAVSCGCRARRLSLTPFAAPSRQRKYKAWSPPE